MSLKKSVIYITWIKIFSLFLGLFLLGLGWFISKDNYEISEEKIIFMLDVSNSMNVQDVFYNGNQISRLDMAKLYIKEFVNNGNNNVGLILFAGKANFFMPPTKDKLSIITYLDTINSNSVIGGGSNVYEALNKFLENTNEDAIGYILSDFGDSVDFQEQSPFIEELDTKGRKITPIGIGTERGGLVLNSNNDLISELGVNITDSLNISYLEKISDIVSHSYMIFNDEREFDIEKQTEFTLLGSENISPRRLLMVGGFFVVIGL